MMLTYTIEFQNNIYIILLQASFWSREIFLFSKKHVFKVGNSRLGDISAVRSRYPRSGEYIRGQEQISAIRGRYPRSEADIRGQGQISAIRGRYPRSEADIRDQGNISAVRGRYPRSGADIPRLLLKRRMLTLESVLDSVVERASKK